MPVAKDRQSIARGIASRGRSTIAGANAGGDAGGIAAGETTEPCIGRAGNETASESGLESADMASTTGEDGGAAGMVSVSRCSRSGIAKEAISTTVHAVI